MLNTGISSSMIPERPDHGDQAGLSRLMREGTKPSGVADLRFSFRDVSPN